MFSSSFGSGSAVSSNIQHYLAQATLPKLRLAPTTPPVPPDKHKAHRNFLTIRPERYRRLCQLHRIRNSHFDNYTLDFIRKHIPFTPTGIDDVDPDTEERPCVPCHGYNVSTLGTRPLRRIDELGVSWIENIVLRTILRILQMIPEYRPVVEDYSFTYPDAMRDEDHKLFQYIMWEKSIYASDSSEKSRTVPSFDECLGSSQKRFNTAHKVWGKLYDICKQNDCSRFVLTNYNQWVFGGFSSQSWQYGFTTRIKQACTNDQCGQKSNSKEKQPVSRTPTVLEYLTYWIVSSMFLPDHFVLPSVLEMVDLQMAINDDTDMSPHPPSQQNLNVIPLGNNEPSESAWSQLSKGLSDISSSAGVQICLQSDSGNTPPPFLNADWQSVPTLTAISEEKENSITEWKNNVPLPPANIAPAFLRSPSPALSGWSEASVATKEPKRSQGFFNTQFTLQTVYEFDFME
ncbi:hypothetical protein EW145_g4943 [Phellinidium pouzarii]|uniref:Uncharacterized protein n=1 Tax=Phellinidium pouzarii TaxID=167371 RepID=A0A4S4L1Y4_9AGAM|nr:hypothetical protein EW145_g4943 [Phellinidium pouzarii]